MKKDDRITTVLMLAAGALMLGGMFVSGGLAVVAIAPLIMAFIWHKAVRKEEGLKI